MNSKKYYFLSGMPRAGNTILSCVLNQNKKISVSGNSLISETLFKLDSWKETDVAYKNFPDEQSYQSMMKSIIPSYYSKWNAEYIIDRSSWVTPAIFSLIEKYCPNEIKIVCLIRNTFDIFKSWIDWSNKNPDNFINRETNNGTIEEKFEYIFNPHRQLIHQALSINTLNKIDPQNNLHILVDYDDFTNNPQKEVERIYEFLNIPQYSHNYKKIKQLSVNDIKYSDDFLGKNLHSINSNGIYKRKYRVDISDYIRDKCLELDSLIK
jgi:sulfotransferase